MLWVLLLKLADVSDLVVRRPADVLDYLFTDPDAAENRAGVLGPLWQTLLDAGIGFVAGLTAADVLATGMVLSKGVEAAIDAGRDAGAHGPAGRARADHHADLRQRLRVRGGDERHRRAVPGPGDHRVRAALGDPADAATWSTSTAARRSTCCAAVAYPTALPSIFAAIRISVPGAITGALIAEYFTSTDSVGKAVNTSLALYKYDQLWALVVVVTLVSIVLYMVAQACERVVLARFGQSVD